jgi:crossover junction endodeoxyribonuclease RusA
VNPVAPPWMEFIVPGEPIPKGRPRFVRGSGAIYTPKPTREAEAEVAACFAATHRDIFGADWVVPDAERHWHVDCLFRVKTLRRRDLDNLLKLVLDALNGVVWVDDSQVTYLTAGRLPADEQGPFTLVRLAALELGDEAA